MAETATAKRIKDLNLLSFCAGLPFVRLFHNREPRASYFNTKMNEFIIFGRQTAARILLDYFFVFRTLVLDNFFLETLQATRLFPFRKIENVISLFSLAMAFRK